MSTHRLRIAHVLWDGDHGGSQRYVEHLVAREDWHDVEHIVAFMSHSGALGSTLDELDVPHLAFGLRRGWDFARARRLVTWCAQRGVDVVHIHCDSPAALLLAPILQRRHRVVFTEHGDSLARTRRRGVLALVWRGIGRALDGIVANSHFTRSRLSELHPHLASRVTVLHNFLVSSSESIPGQRVARSQTLTSTAPSRMLGSDIGWSCGAPTVGVVARLAHEKGVDRFVEVAARIHADRPDVRFAIYGDGPERDALHRLVEERGLADALQFHGFIDTPRTALAQLALTVVPSRVEAFGLTALESLSVGTPVATFVGSGVAEIVRDGVDGCVVGPHGDLDAMAETCLDLLADPDELCAMGDRGRRRANHDFDRASHVEVLTDLYRRITSTAGTTRRAALAAC